MASDASQYKNFTHSRVENLPVQHQNGVIELSRMDGFVDGHDDIFDVLARQSRLYSEDKKLQNAVETTISILRNAQDVIHEQSSRISTLETLGIHDELTGLLNLKGLSGALLREASRAKRKGDTRNLYITLQLDNLAHIEARHGDEAARAALKLLAINIQKQARSTDLCARLCRDEFALTFLDTNSEHSIPRIQALNLSFNKLSYQWKSDSVPLLVSIAMRGCGAEDIEDLGRDLKARIEKTTISKSRDTNLNS